MFYRILIFMRSLDQFQAQQKRRQSTDELLHRLFIIINYLGTSILVAGRDIVDKLIFARINLPHSQYDKIQKPIHICNSQQIIFGRMGGHLHDLVYSVNSISNSNHKDSDTTRFQCIGIWHGQVCIDV